MSDLKGNTVSAPPAVLYPVILPVESQIGSKPPNLLFNAGMNVGEDGWKFGKENSMINEKIKVIICGDADSEHRTYVENDGKYLEFYTDGWDGTSSKDIISLLKFLGHEIFEVYDSSHRLIPEEKIINKNA